MANLKQLSEKLGLSQTTVSRALNGYPEVSEKTRQRVKEAAEQLDYAPNPSARGLATGKARTIGHVIPISTHDMINPHFTEFIAGAGVVYQKRGYDLLMTVAGREDEADAYRKLKRDRRVDGVIVHGPLADDPRISLLKDLDIPFVVHGRTLDNHAGYHWVDVNNRRSFKKATEHLIDLGHQRIALINGMEHMVFAIKRREGFEEAMEEADITINPLLLASGEMIEPLGYVSMRRFLAIDTPPTAVICASMLPAMGAVRAIQECGLQPGKDISIISHDDRLSFMLSDIGNLTLTVMRSGIREAGEVCGNMLINQIEGIPGPDHVLLEAQFVPGSSTAPPRQA